MSELFLKRLHSAQFKDISNRPWIQTLAWWVIDSKYRKTKRLDSFLRDQLNFVHVADLLYKLAWSLRGRNPYDTVKRIEEYVIRNYAYKTDKQQFDMVEYWAEAKEVLGLKADDCDGQNGLIFILCRLAGIPSSNLYCCLGDTRDGGYHFWVIFWDSRRSRFVALDSTYYPKIQTIAAKPAFRIASSYKSIDFAFNDTGIWKWQ